MSGKQMIQMIAEGKLNVRHQVNFLILIPASELTQDWSEPLANEVDKKKATSFPRILELNKGWWSYRFSEKCILFCPYILQH